MRKSLVLVAILFLIGSLAIQCDEKPNKLSSSAEKEELAWLNHHDTVGYVGMQTCMTCHAGIHQTFSQTGMGQSLAKADTLKSIADIDGHSLLYDEYLDYYYQPFWENNQLYLKEFRIEDGDTTHQLVKIIDYVIGSGQHTNSHLLEENSYFHQAPFTWYAQEQKLDFPPGFEDGNNSRFSRIIGLECMSCHNAMPTEFVMGSSNKFKSIPEGINCERCHGPGEAHVAKISRGEITDTSKMADRSIVNPKRLSAQLQFEICQRCHLQGNAVLKPGKSFFDFKPGMELKEVMQVFLPRYSDSEDRFIMASHADRFKLSKCYQSAPEQYTCTSCHNPHLSVKETNLQNFNLSCTNCHGQSTQVLCSASAEARALENDNCVKCHMPPSQASDIPHVTVHDHYIRKPQQIADALEEKGVFIELKSINDEQPSARDKALAYLQQYERFGARNYLLDSAATFLNQVAKNYPERIYLWTYYFYLAQDYEQLYHFASQYGLERLMQNLNKRDYSNKDAWTAYRLAEAYKMKGEVQSALALYERAVELAPFIGDFKNKFASLLYQQKQISRAESLWKEVLAEESYHKEALNNLAFLYLQQGRIEEAGPYLEQCIEHYPDYLLAWQNLGRWAMQKEDAETLKKAVLAILRLDPNNQQAQNLYQNFFQ